MESPIPTIEFMPPPSTLPLRDATALPSLRSDVRSIRGEVWELVGPRPMKRRRIQSSHIWEHGDEYRKMNSSDDSVSWLCDHCDRVISLSRTQSTGNIWRHLREEHQLTQQAHTNMRDERVSRGTSSNESNSRASSVSQPRASSILSFMSRVDVVEFRNLLIRWVVQQQIPHSAVDQQEFRNLLLYLAPGLKDTLSTSHTTIARWIQAKYRAAK